MNYVEEIDQFFVLALVIVTGHLFSEIILRFSGIIADDCKDVFIIWSSLTSSLILSSLRVYATEKMKKR